MQISILLANDFSLGWKSEIPPTPPALLVPSSKSNEPAEHFK